MPPAPCVVQIAEVIPRNPSVKSFRFAAEDPAVFKAGQFLSVAAGAGPGLKKYLSISNSPTERGYIEFTKRLTQSDFSRALDRLRPGDRVTVQYPMGRFTLPDPSVPAAFLAGGIGITPVRGILRWAADAAEKPDLALLYAAGREEDLVFREDFEALCLRAPGIRVGYVLCDPPPGFPGRRGLITAEAIRGEIPDFARRTFYVCGPPAMVTAMQRLLQEELALPREGIVTEQFTGY